MTNLESIAKKESFGKRLAKNVLVYGLTAVFTFMPVLGCEKKESSTQRTSVQRSSDPKIQEAIDGIVKIKERMPNYRGYDLPERLLTDPDTTGTLKQWGCIAIFNDNGEVKTAYTLRVMDFTTGNRYKIREYTPTELNEARPQILAYKRKMKITKNFPIPMVSHSMKLAVAEMILHKSHSIQYSIGRGSGRSAHELQIMKIQNGKNTLVAADALYMDSSNFPK